MEWMRGEIRHRIPRLCDNRETQRGRGNGHDCWICCPTQVDAGTFKSRDKTFTALPRRWSMGKSIRSIYRFRLPFFQSSFLRVPSIYTTLARILDIKPKPDHCRSIESSTRARCNTRLSTRNVDLTFFFFFFVSFFSSSRRFHASRNLVDAVLKKSYVSFFFHFFFFVSRCTFPSNWIHLAWKINWPERSSSYKFITGSFRYDE